jgi:uridine kinase
MLIIGIAGGTGSGKTTVVHQIMNELPDTEVGVISQDSYYKETHNLSFDERALINFDHPRSIDFELLVKQVKQSISRYILLFSTTELTIPFRHIPEK